MNRNPRIVRAYWAAARRRTGRRFGALLADDVVYEVPQTRERVRGREAYVRFNREYPGDWHLTVERAVGEGRHAATWTRFPVDGAAQYGPVLLRARRRRPDRPHHRLLAGPTMIRRPAASTS